MHDSKEQRLILHYASALAEYLRQGDDDSLKRARDIGRLAGNIPILPHQLVLIHAAALLDCAPSPIVRKSTSSLEFLAQALIALEQESASPESLEAACNCGIGAKCVPVDAVFAGDVVVSTTRRRREFLADLNRRIVTSPNPKAEFSASVELAVPDIAGCSALHWIDAEGQPILAVVKGSSARGTFEPWCESSRCLLNLHGALDSKKVNVKTCDSRQAIQEACDNDRGFCTVVVPLVANGQVLGAVTLCWGGFMSGDIRVEQEFGEQLACCTQRAFESARYRTIAQNSCEFMEQHLSRAVHDLSTPLATLSLVLQIGLGRLQRGDAPNERTFRKALAQVEQMTVMIRELGDATGEELDKSEPIPGESAPSKPNTLKGS